jgi:hypothetical protein
MILLFIIGISLIQFRLYYLNVKYGTKVPNYILLFGILACHYFVFPELFYPDTKTIRINCGLPIFGINIAFWTLGTIAVSLTHIIWTLWKLKKEST